MGLRHLIRRVAGRANRDVALRRQKHLQELKQWCDEDPDLKPLLERILAPTVREQPTPLSEGGVSTPPPAPPEMPDAKLETVIREAIHPVETQQQEMQTQLQEMQTQLQQVAHCVVEHTDECTRRDRVGLRRGLEFFALGAALTIITCFVGPVVGPLEGYWSVALLSVWHSLGGGPAQPSVPVWDGGLWRVIVWLLQHQLMGHYHAAVWDRVRTLLHQWRT